MYSISSQFSDQGLARNGTSKDMEKRGKKEREEEQVISRRQRRRRTNNCGQRWVQNEWSRPWQGLCSNNWTRTFVVDLLTECFEKCLGTMLRLDALNA